MNIGPESIFIRDPVQEVESRSALKRVLGDADCTGTPLMVGLTFPAFLQIYLEVSAHLENGVCKNGFKPLSILVIIAYDKVNDDHDQVS